MSSSNCCFLTCIQISQEAGRMVWYSNLLKNFPACCDSHKGFAVVNKAEVDVLLELLPLQWSNRCWQFCSSAFSNTSLNMWKFTVDILLKSGLENFQHYFGSLWDDCNCAVVWTFFGISCLWGLEWKLTFSSPVATAEFSKFAHILSAAISQHHLLAFEIAQWTSITSTSFVLSDAS